MLKKGVMSAIILVGVIFLWFLLFAKPYYLVQAKNDFIVFTHDSYDQQLKYCKDCKYGLMDRDGNILYKAEFKNIIFHGNIILLIRYDQVGVLNLENNQYETYKITSGNIQQFNDVIHIEVGHKDFIIDLNGNVYEVDQSTITSFIGKSDSNLFSNNRSLYLNYNGSYGYIDSTGKTIIPPIYDFATPFIYKNLSLVKQNNQYGMIDVYGNIIIDLIYDQLLFSSDEESELILAKKDGKYGYINYKGQTVIDFLYDNAKVFHNDLAIVTKDTKFGIINQNGGQVVDFIYDNISEFKNGYALVSKDYMMGIIDETGQIIISPSFNFILNYDFTLGLMLVNQGGKLYLVNTKGDIIKEINGEGINQDESFYQQLIPIKKGHEWSLINFKGEMVIDYNNYQEVRNLGDYLMIRKSDKWAIFDSFGNKYSDFIFDQINHLDFYSEVNMNNQVGLLNEQGHFILECKYNVIKLLPNRFIIVTKNGKTGVIHMNQKQFIDFNYDHIEQLNDEEFVLEKNGSLFLTNKNGDIIKIKGKLFW